MANAGLASVTVAANPTTPRSIRARIRKPDLVSDANMVTTADASFDDIDGVIIPIYPNTSTRDSRNPSPIHGQMCYITDDATGGRVLQGYNGSAWTSFQTNPRFAQRSITDARANTTTLANDSELSLSLEANSTYEFEMFLYISGDPAGDVKYGLTHPTGSSASWSAWAPGITFASASGEGVMQAHCVPLTTGTSSGPVAAGCTSTTIPLLHWVRGVLVVASTAGSLTLQWAQNALSSNGTEIRQGSYMTLERVG